MGVSKERGYYMRTIVEATGRRGGDKSAKLGQNPAQRQTGFAT
jgi:hypothetical protein